MLKKALAPIACAALFTAQATLAHAEPLRPIDLDECRDLKSRQEIGGSLSEDELARLALCISESRKQEQDNSPAFDPTIIFPLEQGAVPPAMEEYFIFREGRG